jgi:hypothetical protein
MGPSVNLMVKAPERIFENDISRAACPADIVMDNHHR